MKICKDLFWAVHQFSLEIEVPGDGPFPLLLKMAENNLLGLFLLLGTFLLLSLGGTSATETTPKFELLVDYNGHFYRVKLQGESASLVEEHSNLLIGDRGINLLARDAKARDLFVVDNGNKKIFRMSEDNAEDVQPIAEEGIGEINSIVFDEATENLFWTDKEHRTVESLSTETHAIKRIHTFAEGDIPLAVVAAPKKGLLFVAVNKRPLKVMKLSINSTESSYISLRISHRGPDTWSVDSEDANVQMTIDEKNSVVFVSLGRTINSFNYESHVNAEVTRMPSNVNRMILNPKDGKFIWTGSDGRIHWNDRNNILVKELVGVKSTEAVPAIIPFVPFN